MAEGRKAKADISQYNPLMYGRFGLEGHLFIVHLPTRLRRCIPIQSTSVSSAVGSANLEPLHFPLSLCRRSETKAHDERQHSPAQPDKGLGRAKQPEEMGKPNSAPDKEQPLSLIIYHLSARFIALFTSVTSFASEYFIQLFGNLMFSAYTRNFCFVVS